LELQTYINKGDPDVNTQAVLRANIGDCLFKLGQLQDAEEHYKACLALATKAEDPRVAGEALSGLGRLAFARGEFEMAEDCANQVLALVDPKADVLRLTNAIFIKIKLSILRGEIDGVCDSLENIIRLAASQDSQPYMVRSLVLLSEAQIAQQNLQIAETSALRACEMAAQSGLKLEWIAALRNLALIQEANKRPQEAMETIRKAIKLARAMKSPYEIGLTLLMRAQLQDDPALAVIDAQEALKLFDKLDAKYLAFQTRQLIIEYDLSKGDA
jgi:tetratricopeptide (TPR) repeat protein